MVYESLYLASGKEACQRIYEVVSCTQKTLQILLYTLQNNVLVLAKDDSLPVHIL